jgi:2-polyprenyl-6-methoxyphenol hydroxylase-like FAD-dependent oxidoreductase
VHSYGDRKRGNKYLAEAGGPGSAPDSLETAAAKAGVKVELGVSVHGLLSQGEPITGAATSTGQRRARLVTGADGRNSRIARLAGAKTYHDHPDRHRRPPGP